MAVVSVWLVKHDSGREFHLSNADLTTVFKNLQGAADMFTLTIRYIQQLILNIQYNCGNITVFNVNKNTDSY